MIKQPLWLGISSLLLLAVIWFVADRYMFLQTAERTVGKVTGITARNDRCGGKNNRHSCTRFSAAVAYTAGQGRYSLSVSAGSTRGHNQPISGASLWTGSVVNIIYNPKKPTEAYEDSVSGVWGTPLMVLFMQIATFFTSLTEPRRRRSELG